MWWRPRGPAEQWWVHRYAGTTLWWICRSLPRQWGCSHGWRPCRRSPLSGRGVLPGDGRHLWPRFSPGSHQNPKSHRTLGISNLDCFIGNLLHLKSIRRHLNGLHAGVMVLIKWIVKLVYIWQNIHCKLFQWDIFILSMRDCFSKSPRCVGPYVETSS